MIFLFFPFCIPYFTVVLVVVFTHIFFLSFLFSLLFSVLFFCAVAALSLQPECKTLSSLMALLSSNLIYTYRITHTLNQPPARTHINTNMRGTKYYCINSSRILIWYQNHIRPFFRHAHISNMCRLSSCLCVCLSGNKIYTHKSMY